MMKEFQAAAKKLETEFAQPFCDALRQFEGAAILHYSEEKELWPFLKGRPIFRQVEEAEAPPFSACSIISCAQKRVAAVIPISNHEEFERCTELRKTIARRIARDAVRSFVHVLHAAVQRTEGDANSRLINCASTAMDFSSILAVNMNFNEADVDVNGRYLALSAEAVNALLSDSRCAPYIEYPAATTDNFISNFRIMGINVWVVGGESEQFLPTYWSNDAIGASVCKQAIFEAGRNNMSYYPYLVVNIDFGCVVLNDESVGQLCFSQKAT